MKKFVSLLLTVVLLATMLSVFAVPAFAEDEPTEITVENYEIHAEGNCIISAGTKVAKVIEVKENSTLTIAKGATVVANQKFINNGTVIVNGKLDIKTCKEKTGVENVNVGATGHFEVESPDIGYKPGSDGFSVNLSSTLSEGSLTIIVGVAAAVVFGLGGFILGTKKKKKPAVASGTDEE